MTGFEFQLAKAVLEIVRTASVGEGQTFIEVLSDIVTLDGAIVIGQAKRTLSSSALHSALAELWEIEQLARRRTPILRPWLRFEIQSARRVLSDWKASLDRWKPDGADLDELAEFKGRVSIAVTPSPRLEAARLLITNFKDETPLDRVDRVIGRLLAAAEGSLDTVVEEFRVELAGLKNAMARAERRFGLWGAEDRPPALVLLERNERLAVRIGERLTVADLREGRLATRAVYNGVEQSCEKWLAAEALPYKLPLFWIEGRSGSGKSAATLHLAARLHAQDPDRVILWLGDQSDRVAEAVRWSHELLRSNRTVLIFLDDPCTPERQQSFAKAVEEGRTEWEALRGSSTPTGAVRPVPPALVCCGPAEQRMATEDLCGSDVEIFCFELPRESEGDLAELAHWYTLRTGRSVQALSGNVLLVQQIFEWTKGSIRDFSARFRERLVAFDGILTGGTVFGMVSEILALGRLYVDYPISRYHSERRGNPRLEQAFIQLAEEEAHLAFDPEGSAGVRLTHPHLADAIYREWFGRPTDRPYRRLHLENALSAALDQPDAMPPERHAALWAVARLAQDQDHFGHLTDPDLKARLDLVRTELSEVLRKIYARRWGTTAPLEDLPVWIGLDADLALSLTPSPTVIVTAAVSSAKAPGRGLRLSCHKLLLHGALDERHVVADLLIRLADWRGGDEPWFDWGPLAIDFIRRCGAEPILGAVASLVRRAADWRWMGQLIAEFVLQREVPEVNSIALDWLQRTPSTQPGWALVLSRVHEVHGRSDIHDAIALRFLHANADDPYWGVIWAKLVNDGIADRTNLVERGLAWLGVFDRITLPRAGPDHAGFDRVWQRVWAELADRPDDLGALIERGFQWLSEVDAANEGWSHIWVKLWENSGDEARRPRLLEIGEAMLAVAPPSLLGWSYVWTRAVAASRGEMRTRLIELGVKWVTVADKEHLGWGFVWEGLVKSEEGVDRQFLLRLGEEWLEQVRHDHRSWAFVLQLVWSASQDPAMIARLFELAIRWLQEAVGRQGWAQVLTAAMARQPAHGGFPELLSSALTWLRDSGHNADTGPAVWLALRAAGAPHARLLALAIQLLDTGYGEISGRASVCSWAILMAKEFSEDMEHLCAHSRALLPLALDAPAWPFLWDATARRCKCASDLNLAALAARWLVNAGIEHQSWSKVFLRAHHVDPSSVDGHDVHTAAVKGLRSAVPSKKWMKVWRALPDRNDLLHDEGIQARALSVLRNVPDDSLWPILWQALLQRPDAGAEAKERLLDISFVWLSAPSPRNGWDAVWRKSMAMCDRHAERRNALVEVGLIFLSRMPVANGWYSVFQKLRRIEPSRMDQPTIFRAADAWLGSDLGRGEGWYSIMRWRNGHQPGPYTNENVRKRAAEWLNEIEPDHTAWSFVWRPLHDNSDATTAAELRELAERWLMRARFDHPSWSYIWLALWSLYAGVAGGRRRLRELAADWLPRVRLADRRAQLIAARVRPGPQARQRKRKTPSACAGGR